jgi:hypothetical protein
MGVWDVPECWVTARPTACDKISPSDFASLTQPTIDPSYELILRTIISTGIVYYKCVAIATVI